MNSQSENLAIVFTDIAGYTEATASRSRADTANILRIHNEILLPIVEAYRGFHVKSIGDSLLLTFSSPTDALLASMAMQDSLYSYNDDAPENQQIHIRIAVNVGEVRFADGDVVGDPVNVASRIESLTPVGEIYFSEAVYMTMNKAEISSSLVGEKVLKGIPEPVKIYSIPKFSSTRLVADSSSPNSDLSDTNFPYGGKHFNLPSPPIATSKRPWFIASLVVAVLLSALVTTVVVKKIIRSKVRKKEPTESHEAVTYDSQQQLSPRSSKQKALGLKRLPLNRKHKDPQLKNLQLRGHPRRPRKGPRKP